MRFEPKDLFEKLEFDKVINLVVSECLGELGAQAAAQLFPQKGLHKITLQLREVAEYKLGISENDRLPVAAYDAISEDLKLLQIEESVLPVEGLQRINITLLNIRDIFQFFKPERQGLYPSLYQIIQDIEFDEGLIAEIERVIDEEGEIRPNASPALLKIRKNIGAKTKEVDKRFRELITDYRAKGWLADTVESLRNSRRVLTVPAEHKRKVRGIIHDESSTGKTVFIEPEGVIPINNELFNWQQEEHREILRILRDLSAALRPYVPVMETYQELLVRFDVIQAKARVAVAMGANKPKLSPKPKFGFKEAYHPLLLLKNKALEKPTIPFDLELLHQNRILVLSGPNAGGKSITMKSVGLLQLMLQSGMLVPVDPESEMGIFHNFFADIGDQQSIEDDLSTYSSRLRNMRTFLDHADKKSLVLIDEFGSGTDPKIGGAIAESILKKLNEMQVHGVITTHYPDLKVFAFKNKGIVNGSMNFDKDSLSPTYELKVGRPGSSYAYEIAQKSGLSDQVLKYAKHRTGKNEKAVDELLVDLQREMQELQEELSAVREREKKLDKLIKTYEDLHRDLEVRRKKHKLETKEQALQQSAQTNKELENLIRKIKEEKNLEEAKAAAVRIREQRKQLDEEVKDLREAVYYAPPRKKKKRLHRPLQVGDYVKLRTGGATGSVEDIDNDKVIVHMGLMRVTVNVRDLELADAPLEVQSSKSIQADNLVKNAGFQSKLDIRGMRYEEADKMVEDFLDQALISSATDLRIVHGKGTGVLRKLVKNKLREYNVDMEVSHPEPEQGGDGVTIVQIK